MNAVWHTRSDTVARGRTRGRVRANHVQAGNIALSVQVMLGWLDSMDRRDSQPGLMS